MDQDAAEPGLPGNDDDRYNISDALDLARQINATDERVYVHLYDEDNASVYATHNAALHGISINFDEEGSIDDALYAAENQPGEAIPVPGGVVRCLTVERTEDA